MNNLATTRAEVPVQDLLAYQHPQLKADYLRELTALWMRSDFMRTSKIIIDFVDRLKKKHGLEKVGNCMAYYLVIGSTPPIANLEQSRYLRKELKIETELDPFFDFEGEDSVFNFIEARVRKAVPAGFKVVNDRYLACVAAQEANPDTKSVLTSGTYRIGD